MIKYHIIANAKNKIINFVTDQHLKKGKKNKSILIKNKEYDLFGYGSILNKNKIFIVEQEKEAEDSIINLMNFNLYLVRLIITQEYELLKLQNYKKVENNSFLYELLYLGLQEKILDQSDTKPLIEAFYQTNRLTENQYLTLVKKCYLEDKEYE